MAKTEAPAGISSDAERSFLAGGGEMGALIRAYDWAASPIGPPESWPLSLRTVVRLVLTTRHPMFVWWGPQLIQFYNDAYRQTMGPERHPSALGQRGRDCWEEIWPIIGPQIELVMRGDGATWHEDQLVPVTRFGKREDVWWTYGYSPIDDGSGGVGGVLVVCKDVTDEHNAMERLRVMFQQAPGFVAVLRGRDHVFEMANDAYRALVGQRDVVGRPVIEALPEVVGQGFVELLDNVFATGEPFIANARPVTLLSAGGALERRYLDFVYQPILSLQGDVTAIFVQGHDVTEERESLRRSEMLAKELTHRVKNTLAMVQAIAQQTLRDDADVSEAREVFTARLRALSRTHDFVTMERREGAELAFIVNSAIEHHGGLARFTISGPQVRIAPRAVTAISMALHELSTNAAKYGALSVPDGRVDIAWAVTGDNGRGRLLTLRWTESGGPPVKAPLKQGFGSRLIKTGLAMELGGKVDIIYDGKGVVCVIEAPLAGIEVDLDLTAPPRADGWQAATQQIDT